MVYNGFFSRLLCVLWFQFFPKYYFWKHKVFILREYHFHVNVKKSWTFQREGCELLTRKAETGKKIEIEGQTP